MNPGDMNPPATAARIQSLFGEALDLDVEARARWLGTLRFADPEAAAQVERLLTLDAERADPFGNAIDSLKQTLEFDASEWIGREVGGFRLLRLLGQGGMGTVFLAERQMRDFQQLVALKLLRGFWFERSALERFAEERRILARLHHPNIATLIDAGATDDDRPFLVMEYIEGVPLLDYCDAGRLDLPARLRLMRGLLAALAYAHRALVVHRDLKPGNVLVTPDGTPKLLDFGIARLLEVDAVAAATATATRVFTPDYASPEQLAGEPVGTGSDLYSFGLVLYELCVGVLPWDSGVRPMSLGAMPLAPSERFRRIDAERGVELARRRGSDPQRLLRGLRGDPGRVLARCLDPDPLRRYATAQALDDDLVALLERRPPPGVQVPRRERARAFVRRHAWPLALGALVATAGTALLVQSLLAGHRLSVERDRALAAARSARIEAAKAERVSGFVQTMLASIDPDRAHGMDRSLMRLVLDSAAERARHELKDQPEVRMAIERTIASSYLGIGEYALAIRHFDAALAAASSAGAGPQVRVQLLVRKARSLDSLGQVEQAIEVVNEALHIAATLPAESRDRLLAESTMASLECDIGKFQSCHDRFTRVLAAQRRVLGVADADTEKSMGGLASADARLARYSDAQSLYEELIASYRAKYGDSNSQTLRAINGLAVSYLNQNRFAAAETLLKPAVALAEQVFGSDHLLTVGLLSNLGDAIRQQPGRKAEARPYYEKVLATWNAQYGADSRQSVYAETSLALLLRDSGDLADAERHARAAVAHMDRAFGADSVYRGMLLDNLASVLIDRRKYAEAERALAKAYEVYRSAQGFGPGHPDTQAVIRHYIDLYTAMNRPALAARWRALLVAPVASAKP
ncbi:MAG TPA: serine/threonine-protein kinase [Rhodanobacteraceae bacterium]|nr:serine/threonine-protein kinase [Rhodanobacteraceae bacterium]